MEHKMKEVIPYHVIIGVKQLMGMAKEVTEFIPCMILRDAVNITYQALAPGKVNRLMTTIDSDPDYNGGDIPIFLGPGVILFKVHEMGALYKQYLEVKSGLVVPDRRLN